MASFGETLKRQRELREISLRQISEATKINIRYLEALEQNHFDILPGGLFNKGFIRAYAAYVGLDGEAMVNSYLSEIGSRQTGSPPQTPEPAKLHRPAGPPQRRSGPGRDSASPPAPPAGPAITFAPAPVETAERAPAVTGETASPQPPQAPHATHYETQKPHAITRIADLPPEQPDAASPRALFWILLAVVGAGVVLLVLSLVSGPKPVQEESQPPSHGPASEADTGEATWAAGLQSGPARNPSTPDPDSTGGEITPPRPAAAVPPPTRSAAPATGAGTVGSGVPAPPPAPARPHGEQRHAGSPESAVTGPMNLDVTAVWSSWVELSCDGQTVIDRQMRPGETESFRCGSVIRASATDAGAVRLRVNGTPCLPMGDPGARAYGYTIRADDFAKICRPEQRGVYERP